MKNAVGKVQGHVNSHPLIYWL